MVKNYELIGCCGMSCSLCPRFHTNGKSKSLIILHFLFFNIRIIKEVMRNGEKINEPDLKQKAKEFKRLLKKIAEENGIKITK